MSATVEATYDKGDLRIILRSYKAMEAEAVEVGKKVGYELASEMLGLIKNAARTAQEQRIAGTGRASKSSKIGEFMFGYERTAFSGGAATFKNFEKKPPYGKGILAGVEFGSDRLPNFRPRSAGLNGGNEGYWIYPTLRANQDTIIAKWEAAFSDILRKF